MGVYTWFWIVFIVNVFIYAIYLPSVREAMSMMTKDVMSTFLPCTTGRQAERSRLDSSFVDRGVHFSNAVETRRFD